MLNSLENIDESLYQNRKDFPAEIVYEITTLKNELPFGIAIADIMQSVPHFHKVTRETYTVVQGEIEVSLGSDRHRLTPGDAIQIPPNVVHSARSLGSSPARITVTTIPEFSPDDYYALASSFETRQLSKEYDYLAPDGTEIRLLPSVQRGGLCHCTLPAGKTSFPVMHQNVEEIWYVIGGEGEVWRRAEGTEEIICVTVGTSLVIPPRTAFQFRNTGAGPLCILIVTMPPWPGLQEATQVVGVWPVAVNSSAESAAD